MPERPVYVHTGEIKLDSFLKLAGIVQTGGQAKVWLQEGLVQVNGQPESRRGRKLYSGDIVTIESLGSFKVSNQQILDGD